MTETENSKIIQESHIINASPTKNFFVDMLTRDIELEDAILDLLDNCIDGIQRTIEEKLNFDRPYEKFWAKISFSANGFKIEDNCGGIPLDVAKRYAFRMGRPLDENNIDGNFYTIGTYGIGMKRSIFKMGCSSTVTSQTQSDSFRVKISPDWLSNDSDWELPIEENFKRDLSENGTVIEVTQLRQSILEEFSLPNSTLENSLSGKISHHYSYILGKGFSVSVNGKLVSLMPLSLLWDGIQPDFDSSQDVIAPYLYEAQMNGVDVRLAVGFYRSTASETEVDNETKGTRRSGETAGWTIVCNDRVVVYCDKTRLTGWGEASVPSYHPQFISITGIVHFRSKESNKLPITTTKRGIDSSSEIYLYVKDFMREGLKVFTSYTNQWKKDLSEEKKRIKSANLVDPNEVSSKLPQDKWKLLRQRNRKTSFSISNEKKYNPKLPSPKSILSGLSQGKKITFHKPEKEIKLVSEYLFEDPNRDPSEVAIECFDKILREAK
jgi:Histidine kinase-, DNA gyrase B-, and HSP90-like ATPase